MKNLTKLRMSLEKGTQAPDFTLTDSNGNPFTLSKDAHRMPVLIFFYPRNFTAICTEQACIMRDSYEFFEDMGFRLVGISADAPESHKLFKSYYQLPFELLSDPDKKVAQAYDAIFPVVNIARRVTFLLDPDHRVLMSHHRYLSAESHLNSVVRFIKENHLAERWQHVVPQPGL